MRTKSLSQTLAFKSKLYLELLLGMWSERVVKSKNLRLPMQVFHKAFMCMIRNI